MNDLQKTALGQALTKTNTEDCEDVFDFFLKLLHNFIDAEKTLEGK